MATTAPIFYLAIQHMLDLVVGLTACAVTVGGFAHCLAQRPSALAALGTLPKGGWLALLGVTGLLSLLQTYLTAVALLFNAGPADIFLGLMAQLIGIAAGMVYLLDVRAGLRGMSDGRGIW
ncbi:DUF2516 family protein [Pilimelia columellifera]|uniref:Uncharacterized protein n=1 Tax=Pilimelia columellifera subsp. columellifera TaxID=706583 RepID=A0ABP6AQM3_9ACTN